MSYHSCQVIFANAVRTAWLCTVRQQLKSVFAFSSKTFLDSTNFVHALPNFFFSYPSCNDAQSMCTLHKYPNYSMTSMSNDNKTKVQCEKRKKKRSEEGSKNGAKKKKKRGDDGGRSPPWPREAPWSFPLPVLQRAGGLAGQSKNSRSFLFLVPSFYLRILLAENFSGCQPPVAQQWAERLPLPRLTALASSFLLTLD